VEGRCEIPRRHCRDGSGNVRDREVGHFQQFALSILTTVEGVR
jgi:hypothetical protein